MATLRGMQQPELSKKLFKMIKSENHTIGAYEAAGRERINIASQLSDWGEATGDDSISDISDKLGVLLSEIGEQEDVFAQNLEDYRGVLKQIRNTEGSVQPSRDHKAKVSDEIQKLKYKEPQSTKLVQLEQELVRAEAQNLVAEAQLTNIVRRLHLIVPSFSPRILCPSQADSNILHTSVAGLVQVPKDHNANISTKSVYPQTRQKIKQAYDIHFAAVIERAEKQIMLARHGRRLLNLLDDTPVVPGDTRPAFEHAAQARQVLNDAEEDLREWTPNLEPVTTSEMSSNLMPTTQTQASTTEPSVSAHDEEVSTAGETVTSETGEKGQGGQGAHLAAA